MLGMARLFAAPQLLAELFAFRLAPCGEFVGRRSSFAISLFESLPNLGTNSYKPLLGCLQLF